MYFGNGRCADGGHALVIGLKEEGHTISQAHICLARQTG
jgi:hypothetical protein